MSIGTRVGIAAWAVLAACTSPPGESGTGDETTSNPDEGVAAVEAFVRDSLPDPFSGQVVLARGDEMLLSASFGLVDRSGEDPVTPRTVFDIGSLTKQFTAAAVLRLAEEGRLGVLDTLGLHLPGLPAGPSGLVLRDLLTHSAGLPRYSGDDYEAMSWPDLLAWLRETPIDSAQLGRFSYSNPGYSLLAGVVATVAGEGYESYLHRELLAPAGVEGPGYRLGRARGAVAVGYVGGERFGRPTEQPWAEDGPWWNLRGNGGVLSTGEDLWRWHRALVTGRVLEPATFERLVQPYVSTRPARDRWYGYGWYVRATSLGEVVEHTGGNGAFFAIVRWWRDLDITLVVTNSDFSRRNAAALLNRVQAWVASTAGSP